jgi:methylated-DNA-[protein]-cysteine S-methyltransferase
VWRALLTIPSGHTASYGQIAQACGRASAVRAVGAAIGRNPVGIVVPCHRVLGAGGALTGYAGGLPRKSALLRLEGVRINALAK